MLQQLRIRLLAGCIRLICTKRSMEVGIMGRKDPFKVTTKGDIACADLSGIAKLLVELLQKALKPTEERSHEARRLERKA